MVLSHHLSIYSSFYFRYTLRANRWHGPSHRSHKWYELAPNENSIKLFLFIIYIHIENSYAAYMRQHAEKEKLRTSEINVKTANSNSVIHHHMPFLQIGSLKSKRNETKWNGNVNTNANANGNANKEANEEKNVNGIWIETTSYRKLQT